MAVPVRLFVRCVFIALAALPFAPAVAQDTSPKPAAPATTQASDAKLQVQSLRINRAPANLQKQFQGRYYTDGQPGVSMQLLLTLDGLSVLPVAQNAVSIATFVDDTYQHLIGTGREYGGGGGGSGQVAVSDDGRMILFTVTANRPPADEATRVFVRGTIEARAARGEPKVESAKLALAVGRQAKIGPFTTTVRSLSDSGNGQNLNVALAIDGDALRIREIRLLDPEGRSLLHEARQGRVTDQGASSPAMVHLNLRGPAPTGDVTVEYAYAEQPEPVRIPFEAQADIGYTSAGPVQPGQPKAPAPRGGRPGADAGAAPGGRPVWPPPAIEPQAGLPPRRRAFDPSSTQPADGSARAGKVERAAVDLFSLAVGKPAPGQVQGVSWANPPARTFHPSGFTVVRLMISTPQAVLLGLEPDGVNVTRFEDDKGGKLSTLVYDDPHSRAGFAGRTAPLHTSPDGQQALVTVSVAAAPTPGASRCTLAGLIKARVARGERTESSPAQPLARDQKFTFGPFTVQVSDVRQVPVITPSSAGAVQPIEVWMQWQGPVANIRGIELLDAKTGQLLANRGPIFNDLSSATPDVNNANFSLQLRGPIPEEVVLRVRHHQRTDVVDIPFEISTGLGL